FRLELRNKHLTNPHPRELRLRLLGKRRTNPHPKQFQLGLRDQNPTSPCHSRPLIASHPQSLFQRCPRGRWAKVSRKVFGLCSKILRSLSRGFLKTSRRLL